ncbi:MAG: Holliday junction branch migration protein RuvA [Patescibacteria group bacterium]
MISLVQGKVISKTLNELVVMTAGGVGYRLRTSPSANVLAVVGSEICLETFLSVKEDALDLFGFGSAAEKELFKNFLSVSGVGPKTALHLLDLGGVEEISLAIVRGDIDYLTKVSGIGKKTAERIVVDLKTKLKESRISNLESGSKVTNGLEDVVDALETLGYSSSQAREVIKKLDPKDKTSEQLLREALQKIK